MATNQNIGFTTIVDAFQNIKGDTTKIVSLYNPDNIVITTGNNEIVDFRQQEDTGIIVFDIQGDNTSYQINLSDTLINFLEFELAERKSQSCCGNVTFSNKTILNGQEIENNDLITIK